MPRRLEALADDREPWERQPGETPTQYSRFHAYLEAGPQRKVTTTADELGAARATLHQLSSLMRWRERAELYDAEQQRIRRARQAADAERFREAEARIAAGMLGEVGKALRRLQSDAIPPEQVPRWAEVASKLGRLAYGEPSDLVALTSPADAPVRIERVRSEVLELNPDQRRRLAAELAEEVRRRMAASPSAGTADGTGDV